MINHNATIAVGVGLGVSGDGRFPVGFPGPWAGFNHPRMRPLPLGERVYDVWEDPADTQGGYHADAGTMGGMQSTGIPWD